MKQIYLVSDDNVTDLEESINLAIQDENFNVIDIKYQHSSIVAESLITGEDILTNYYTAMIIYEI